MVRHTEIFRYADLVHGSKDQVLIRSTEGFRSVESGISGELEPWFGRLTHSGVPDQRSVRSTVRKRSAELTPGCESRSLVRSTGPFRSVEPDLTLFLGCFGVC